MNCPTPEELLAYLEGGPEQVSKSQERHIRRCRACASALEELRKPFQILQRLRCPEAVDIADLAAGDLPEEKALAVRRHVEACPPCRALLEDTRETLASAVEPAAQDDAALVRAQARFRRSIGLEDWARSLLDAVARLRNRLQCLVASGSTPAVPVGGWEAEMAARGLAPALPRPAPIVAYEPRVQPKVRRSAKLAPSRCLHEDYEAEMALHALTSHTEDLGTVTASCLAGLADPMARGGASEGYCGAVLEVGRQTLEAWETYLEKCRKAALRRQAQTQVALLRDLLKRLEKALSEGPEQSRR